MAYFLARAAAKTIFWGLRVLGRGATTLPGKVAVKLDKNTIAKAASGKKIITVTGTNGKTTTSHMISEMLTAEGFSVINNISGANLASGVATTLLCGKPENKEKDPSKIVYVLETDEAAFAKIAGSLQPMCSVVTNLFRDQLDRYGELTHTGNMILGGLDKTEAVMILNSDDSLVASMGNGREKRAVFYGLDKEDMRSNNVNFPEKSSFLKASSDAVYCPSCKVKYEYKARSFSHLGDFYCPKCGFSSPKNRFSLRYSLAKSPSNPGYRFKIFDSHSDVEKEIELKIPGMHNLYNTCAAVSCVTVFEELNAVREGKVKEGDSLGSKYFEMAAEASDKVKAAFGRMEKFKVGDKEICILLVKNPAGLDRSLSFISEAEDIGGLMLLLNSNIADGKDVSWIWDVDFESKAPDFPSNICVSGERYTEMLLRVIYAGANPDDIKSGPMEDAEKLLEEALNKCEAGKCVYILPNYTSMLALRAVLVEKYNLKDFWK